MVSARRQASWSSAFSPCPSIPPGGSWPRRSRRTASWCCSPSELGFTEGFIGEHITDAAENIASALIFIAWLLRETSRIRLGTGTVNLPNHHPAMVAAEVALVDHMAKGRFIFGISPGGLPSDAEVFGNLDQDRTAMFVEAIDHILAIWRGEAPYDLAGRFWTISTARTLIPELGQGVIAQAVPAAAPADRGDRGGAVLQGRDRGGGARLGPDLGELPAAAVGQDPLAELCRGLRAGRPQRRPQELAGGQEHLRRRRRARPPSATRPIPGGPYHFYYHSLFHKLKAAGRANLFKTAQDQPDDALDVATIVEQLVIYGTPDAVADQILAFREQVGDFGTLLYAGHDWMDKRLARRSMELMAEPRHAGGQPRHRRPLRQRLASGAGTAEPTATTRSRGAGRGSRLASLIHGRLNCGRGGGSLLVLATFPRGTTWRAAVEH